MKVWLVYGDRNGEARRAALRTARRLRAKGVPARARAAERLTRRPEGAWTVLLVDRSGAAAVRELRDSLGIRCGSPSLAALRPGRSLDRSKELERRWRWRATLLADPVPATRREVARGRSLEKDVVEEKNTTDPVAAGCRGTPRGPST